MKSIIALSLIFFSGLAFSIQQVYCPQKHGYVTTGMTQDQVVESCGEPQSKEQSNQPVYQKIPVLSLIYNNQGTQHAFYGVWSLPVGVSTGATLEVDVINNKVSSVRINGSNSNAFSICSETNIEVGDSVAQVYHACGAPSLVNNTFIHMPMPGKKETWVYQIDQYHHPMSFTFANGILIHVN